MPKCSEAAFENALEQLAEHAASNVALANWMLTFLTAARMQAAGYDFTTLGVDEGARDVYAVLPTNAAHGSINPFIPPGKKYRWRKLVHVGRKTVWNNGTRNNPQRVMFNDNHFSNGLRSEAIAILLQNLTGTALPAREALAVFLTRDHEWESEPDHDTLIQTAAAYIGRSTADFEQITSARALNVHPVVGEPEWSPTLLAESALAPPAALQEMASSSTQTSNDEIDPPVDNTADSLSWTRGTTLRPLRTADIDILTARTLEALDEQHIVLPDMQTTIRRCVTGLLMGHLILQGPPGTGKTTVARALCDAFEVDYVEATATSEWSPFHVIGGYRPDRSGGLTPVLGTASKAMIDCAKRVRSQAPEHGGGDVHPDEAQGTWLFVDEFNRADIDKAIGPLYTLLSSCDSSHLDRTPIDLWFEHEPSRQKLWSPARFRIIAAMNDLDTGFVNAISQGLTRRFQFVTIGVPEVASDTILSTETLNAFAAAHEWVTETYPDASRASYTDTASAMHTDLLLVQTVLNTLRYPADIPGVPIGTAQLVDLFKYVLLDVTNDRAGALAIDSALTDRIIPQMTLIDTQQEHTFREFFESSSLPIAAAALKHLLDPHSV